MAESRHDLHVAGARGMEGFTAAARRIASPALARALFRFRRPSHLEIAAVARANASEPYSYRHVGATAGTPPVARGVRRATTRLGHGPDVFARAMDAVQAWRMFHLPWIDTIPLESPPRAGQLVAYATRHLGLWTLHACRVVYVVEPDEDALVARYGFAVGTLSTHAVRGEERFLVEWDRLTDEVRLELLAFSTPSHAVLRLLAPVTARIQRRFDQDALQAVRSAVGGGG